MNIIPEPRSTSEVPDPLQITVPTGVPVELAGEAVRDVIRARWPHLFGSVTVTNPAGLSVTFSVTAHETFCATPHDLDPADGSEPEPCASRMVEEGEVTAFVTATPAGPRMVVVTDGRDDARLDLDSAARLGRKLAVLAVEAKGLHAVAVA